MTKKTSDGARWRRIWRDYSLSIVLAILFVLSFTGHTVAGWFQYAAEQRSHGQPAEVLGDDGYVWYWAEWTLQNWQSEFLEVAVIVVLSSFLIHKGSAESKDGTDEMKAMLASIERKLDALEQADTPKRAKAG
jgi:hypothetical protein